MCRHSLTATSRTGCRRRQLGVGRRAIAVWLMLVVPSWSQQWHVRTYSAEDGLPSHQVDDLAQLGSGSMAFLTRQGLALYDGALWTVETPFTSMPPWPWRLVAGRGDDLWLHVGGEFKRRSGGAWIALESPPVASSRCCDLLFVGGDETDRLVAVEKSGRLHVFDGVNWNQIEQPAAHAASSFLVTEMLNGKCLVGTERGVVEFDLEKGTAEPWSLDLPRPEVFGLAYEKTSDALWLVGRDWIARVDHAGRGEREITLTRSTERLVQPRGAAENHEGRLGATAGACCVTDTLGGLYVGDRYNIRYFNPATGLERIGLKNGLNTEGINGALQDREGNIWFVGPRGVNKITSRTFLSYNRNQGLFADEVSAAVECADGTLILGHGGGLSIMKRGVPVESVFISHDIVTDRVMDLLKAPDGTVWLAAGRLGVGKLNRDTRKVEWAPIDNLGYVTSVELTASADGLWIGTDKGLFVYEPEKHLVDHVPLLSDASEVQIRKLEADPRGGLLIATIFNGILSLRNDEVRQWTGDTYALNTAYTILRDTRGTLWAGTLGGLARAHEDGTLTLDNRVQVRRPVYLLLEDRKGRLWVGTDTGLRCWDQGELRTLDESHGLLGQETNRSAFMVTKDGRLWFGTNRGISAYDERFDVPRIHGPTVALSRIEAGGRLLELSQRATIGHDEGAVSFHFEAISFVDEDRVRIQTRLEGWDSDWTAPRLEPDRFVRYPKLPPGEYRLHIRAIDMDGSLSPEIVSAPIRIEGPLWSRGWFMASVGGLLLLLTVGAVVLVLQRRYSQQLQREVVTRTEQVRVLEREREQLFRLESLGILAGGIAHDFNNLLTAIIGNISMLQQHKTLPPKIHGMLRDMDAASWRAHALATQLLTFSRGGAPIKEAADLSDVITECTRFNLRGSNVQARFELRDDLYAVFVDSNQISQVFENIVINGRQSMPDGGTLVVRARNDIDADGNKHVVAEFTDEGDGIPEDEIGRVFDPYYSTKGIGSGLGLATAYMIIQRHDGELSVESQPGRGATFRIRLPACAEVERLVETRSVATVPAGTKVLIMDDMLAVRHVARQILEGADCVVVDADDGAAAVSLYEESSRAGQSFDAVIMDLTVPGGMGGLIATRNILEIDHDARIIVSSGYTEASAMASYEQYGFVGRLTKPFAADEVIRALAEVVRRPEALQQGSDGES